MTMSMSRWVPVAFATTGLLIGFLAGLSQSPVVGTLLPLLFAGIAGGAGFFATKKVEHSFAAGLSLTLLTLFCLFGVVWGIRLRQGLRLSCFFSLCTESSPAKVDPLRLPTDNANPERLLHLLSVKIQLQRIQMEDEDRKTIFQLASSSKTDDKQLAQMDEMLFRVANNNTTLTQRLGNPETSSAKLSQGTPNRTSSSLPDDGLNFGNVPTTNNATHQPNPIIMPDAVQNPIGHPPTAVQQPNLTTPRVLPSR